MKRSTTIALRDGANAMAAFAIAPPPQPTAKRRRAWITSARFRMALANVPATKPACTAIVSQAVAPGVNASSRAIAGDAAVAENHNAMPRNCAMAIRHSMRLAICGLR